MKVNFPQDILESIPCVSTSSLIMQVHTSITLVLSTSLLSWLMLEVDQVEHILSIHLVSLVTEKVSLTALVVIGGKILTKPCQQRRVKS
jgi:hypothetical protein